jgi:hypothetical protein
VVSWKAFKVLFNDDIKKKHHHKTITDKLLEIKTLANIKKLIILDLFIDCTNYKNAS